MRLALVITSLCAATFFAIACASTSRDCAPGSTMACNCCGGGPGSYRETITCSEEGRWNLSCDGEGSNSACIDRGLCPTSNEDAGDHADAADADGYLDSDRADASEGDVDAGTGDAADTANGE